MPLRTGSLPSRLRLCCHTPPTPLVKVGCGTTSREVTTGALRGGRHPAGRLHVALQARRRERSGAFRDSPAPATRVHPQVPPGVSANSPPATRLQRSGENPAASAEEAASVTLTANKGALLAETRSTAYGVRAKTNTHKNRPSETTGSERAVLVGFGARRS